MASAAIDREVHWVGGLPDIPLCFCSSIGWDRISTEEPETGEDGALAGDDRAFEDGERVGAYGFVL